MKLIIDIPEDSYRFILQHGIKDTHEIDEVIANGIPYNPTGDTISREALKKILSEPLYRSTIKDYGEILKYTFVIDMIDDAPSVPLPDFKAGYKQAIIDGKANYSRPQGEWVMDKEHTKNPLLWYKCNLCGVYHSPTNFCPNCGADMRKGDSE